jgi:hypothetical protein
MSAVCCCPQATQPLPSSSRRGDVLKPVNRDGTPSAGGRFQTAARPTSRGGEVSGAPRTSDTSPTSGAATRVVDPSAARAARQELGERPPTVPTGPTAGVLRPVQRKKKGDGRISGVSSSDALAGDALCDPVMISDGRNRPTFSDCDPDASFIMDPHVPVRVTNIPRVSISSLAALQPAKLHVVISGYVECLACIIIHTA